MSERCDVTGRPVALRDPPLDRLFSPRTIAVVGASDSEGSGAALNFGLIRTWAAQTGAEVVPVNPRREEVDGLRCYRSLTEAPGEVDVAIVLIPDPLEAVRDAVAAEIPFVVVFTAGFAEAGEDGEERQRRLVETIAGSRTHLLGPNTALNAFQPFSRDAGGRKIALITQSGQQGRPLYQAQEIGVGIWGWAPTGNEADLESADFIRYFADQADVGAIACYIEGFRDGRTLALALDHAATRGVPVVCVKVGRSDIGRSWAKSHSGHLAGADAVVGAVFRQYGVTRVDGLDELLDTSVMFARASAPQTDGVCVYGISGGAGAHLADLAQVAGLKMPELAEETQQRLREWIPGYLRVTNPVDCGGIPAGDERGRKIIDALLADQDVGVLVVPIAGFFPGLSDRLAEDLAAAAEETDKPICVVWGSPVADEDVYRKTLLGSERLIVFRTMQNCVGAVKAYLDHYAFRAAYRPAFRKPVMRPLPVAVRARELLAGGGSLSEHDSKELLAAYEIPVTRDLLCTSAAEAVRAAASIGYPVVLKACGPGLEHKSDLGLVKVGLGSAKQVREAYAAVSPHTDAVLVCEMISGGVECVVGMSTDELFGPVVMFGLGGVAIEVFGDVTFRVPPFDRRVAQRMIREIRAHPLLTGARGGPRADLAAITDVIMKVQRLAQDLSGELAELDINPLLAKPDGAVALDALAVARA